MKSWAHFPLSIALGLIFFVGIFYVGHRMLFPALPLVGIIQWTSEIKGSDDSVQGVIGGLRENGFQEGLNIRIEVVNARGEREKAAAAVHGFLEKGARLLITVGTVPTLMALDITRDGTVPIIYTNVASPFNTGLCPPVPPAKVRFTGTSMEVPLNEQLRFLLLARPGLQRLGILYCNLTPQAVATGEEAVEAAPRLGLTPIRRTVTDERPELLHATLDDLLSENIEALFLSNDPVLRKPHNLALICETASRFQVPVMVPDGASVAYGPLLSYHCDSMEIGHQSGRQAARVLQGVCLSQVPPETPKIKKLTINLKTADKLGILLPRQLISQAYHFYQ